MHTFYWLVKLFFCISIYCQIMNKVLYALYAYKRLSANKKGAGIPLLPGTNRTIAKKEKYTSGHIARKQKEKDA